MNNTHRNAVVVIGIISVISLIILTYSNKRLYKIPETITIPYFPIQKSPNKEIMQALLIGELKLADNCLMVNDNLIVWPYGYSVKRNSTVMIYDDKGRSIAKVGDKIRLVGGQINNPNLSNFSNLDNAKCKGPLWIAGEVSIIE